MTGAWNKWCDDLMKYIMLNCLASSAKIIISYSNAWIITDKIILGI